MIKAKVSKWGNSLAIRLPRAITGTMHLHDGDIVDLELLGGLVTLEKSKPAAAPTLREAITEMDGVGRDSEPDSK